MVAIPNFAGPNLAENELRLRPSPTELATDLQRVQKAAQRITSILDIEPLIESVVSEVAKLYGCVEAAVYLHDEKRGDMVMAGVHGCTKNHKGFRLKIGKEGMVGYVASTGELRYAPDVRKDQYYVGCEHT